MYNDRLIVLFCPLPQVLLFPFFDNLFSLLHHRPHFDTEIIKTGLDGLLLSLLLIQSAYILSFFIAK